MAMSEPMINPNDGLPITQLADTQATAGARANLDQFFASIGEPIRHIAAADVISRANGRLAILQGATLGGKDVVSLHDRRVRWPENVEAFLSGLTTGTREATSVDQALQQMRSDGMGL